MKTIIALTDFSENAHHAVLYALELAKARKIPNLLLINCFDTPMMFQGDLASPVNTDGTPNFTDYSLILEQTKLLEAGNQERMRDLLTELQPKAGPSLALESRVIQGDLEESINDICANQPIDLVIMGITGKSGIEKILVGSHAIKAMETLNTNIIIVPFEWSFTPWHKIVFASDLEPLSEKSMEQLMRIFEINPASFQLVHVHQQGDESIPLQKSLFLQKQLSAFQPSFHLIKAADVELGLHEFTDAEQPDLTIFIHHEKGFLASLFHKSVGKKMVWNSSIPVLRLMS